MVSVACMGKVPTPMDQPGPSPGNLFSGFGTDDRVTPEKTQFQNEARSVATAVPSGSLRLNGSEYVLVKPQTLADVLESRWRRPPCSGFSFASSAVTPFARQACSALAVSSTVMLTARHCIMNANGNAEDLGDEHDRLAYVFGFTVTGPLRSHEVHRAREVLAKGANEDDDWALVVVEPPIPETRIWRGNTGDVTENVAAAALGHPNHLGLLVSPGYISSQNNTTTSPERPNRLLVGDLDVSGGSSGSPVFEQTSKSLVGIVFETPGNNPPTRADQCVSSLFCEMGSPACESMAIIPAERFTKSLEDVRRTQ